MLSPLSDAWPRLDAEWKYDPLTGRYRRPSGRFMSEKAVVALIDGRIDKLGKDIAPLHGCCQMETSRWINGKEACEKLSKVRTFKRLCWVMVAGLVWALKSMAASVKSFVRNTLICRILLATYLAGRVSTPMALARIQLYAESVRGSYWQGTTLRQKKQGYSMMRRVLDSQAAHCDDCLRYAAAGLVPIDSLPMPAQRCECRANCRCSVEYKRGAGINVTV
jgi:hypothetical protein